LVESEGNQTISFRITEFWTLFLALNSKYQKQRFGNWICFHSQEKGRRHILLGPFERANLNHWTTHVITTALSTPDIRMSPRNVTGKYGHPFYSAIQNNV
jgi:hypothetical protein